MLVFMCVIFLQVFGHSLCQTISTRGVIYDACDELDSVPGIQVACDGRKQPVDHLVRIEPKKVGDVANIVIGGRWMKRITRAIQPPVYEIPDMLTDEECDAIMRGAEEEGLHPSGLFTVDETVVAKNIQEKNLKQVTRVSNTSFVPYRGEHLINIRNKVVELTGLPKHIVFESEHLQVLRYGPGGHYHGHWDSENTEPSDYPITTNPRSCCHLSPECTSESAMPGCCRLCRFATVLFFLTDVEEGGETAFPWALFNKDEKLPPSRERHEGNLSYNCKSANLLAKPRRGTAILWYTHFLDEKGYMGKVDPASFHGGCDVIKGTKWIANTWINAPKYTEKDLTSVWKEF